jgi:hypothetical protein
VGEIAGLTPAEVFGREADRLRSMADSFIYYPVRDQFLRMARQYDALARRSAPPLCKTRKSEESAA